MLNVELPKYKPNIGTKPYQLNKAWDRSRRPSQAPRHPMLDRAFEDWDPKKGYFEVITTRAGARDLRKEQLGTAKGVRDVPEGAGEMVFDLPNRWTMRLVYGEPGIYGAAGKVTAEFWPPEDDGEEIAKPAGRNPRCPDLTVRP